MTAESRTARKKAKGGKMSSEKLRLADGSKKSLPMHKSMRLYRKGVDPKDLQ